MKTCFLPLILAVLISASTASAQQNQGLNDESFSTIFGDQTPAVGGYISLGMGNTIINDNNAMLGQFRMAVRLDHSLSIGIAGSAFSDCIYGLNYDRPDLNPDGYYMEGGYGGLLIEPVFAPRFPVHISFPMLIGAGGIAFTGDNDNYDWNSWDNWDDWDNDSHRYVIKSKAFLVVEPGIELEINLARFLRLGAGVSYRFTNGIRVENQSEHLLNGLSGAVNLKFGVF